MHLTIEKLIYGGDGLARLPADEKGRGKAVFVPFVLAGEQVEAALVEEKAGFRAGPCRCDRRGVDRADRAAVSLFRAMRWVPLSAYGYENQLAIKAGILKENLRRLAKLELASEIEVHASPPWGYRNRTRLQVRTEGEFALGYFERRRMRCCRWRSVRSVRR